MKTKDVIDYILSKKTITYYELNRLLYAFQYDRAVEGLPPLMDDAKFFVTGRHVIVEEQTERAYCAFGTTDIFVPGGKPEPDLNSKEKATLDGLMGKYETVAMCDPEFFGDKGLVATIWDNIPKDRFDRFTRPPVTYEAMLNFIHGYEKRGTLDVRVPIDPYVKRTFEPLMRGPFLHEPYGVVTWRKILEWSSTPTPIYTVRLSIMAENRNEPLGFVVEPVYRRYLPYQLGNIPSPKARPYFEDKYESVIDAVVEHFKDWDVTSLTKLTQNQNPWVKARKRRRGDGTIPNRDIQKYFDKP